MADEYTQEGVSPAMTAKGRFESLKVEREPFLSRAREVSKLTIPSLIPPEGSTGATKLPTPYQSVGSKGVNNIASKLLLALFPPGSSFFKLTIDDFVLDALIATAGGGEKGQDAKGQFEKGLAKVEHAVVNRMEAVGMRVDLFEALKHLVAGGNSLLKIGKRGKVMVYPLSHYVCKRDGEGEPLEIVLEQCFAPMTLPPEAKAIYDMQSAAHDKNAGNPTNTVYIYTRVCRKDNRWVVYQELMGEEIPGTRGDYPLDNSPWLPLRLNRIAGEDYGRGLGEEYLGDIYSLESLSQSIVEFAAVAAKILFFVDEGGTTSKKAIAEAPSGTVLDGRAADVSMLGLEKFADFRVAKETADGIEQRLGEAFLLGSAARRDAERVTAEEIRLIAGELEQALGGVYSVLSAELQLPLVKRLMLQMTKEKALPPLPKEAVTPQVVTGLSALGRTSDLQKLDSLLAGTAQIFGPEVISEYVAAGAYMTRRATALGIPDVGDGLIRSEQEVQAQRDQKAKMELASKLGPPAIQANQKREEAAATAATTSEAPE
jgi:hypothetical protein